ncbi:MAG: enoyl-CoA hydratase/isomerase family protein [Bifidobacteriaceae bacterium]|jgi:enoyl-CoA hydratase|nr:enoyl-CoA hydratase/isomerase family protein [Bifidobacteriaceae bacterium]
MSSVRHEEDGPLAIVTIDRPEALNALDEQVISDLDAVIGRLDCDATHCVIVTGAGSRAFVAGADITRMAEMTRGQAAAFSARGNAVFRRLELLAVPVIVAVNGYALGGGCELALACDLRIAADTAVFGQPEVGLGITPGFGGTQRLARIIGQSSAKELLYTGRTVSAVEALRMGLVGAVFPAAQLMAEARALAGLIAANSPGAIRATKAAVGLGLQVDIDTGLRLEAELHAGCFETPDQRERMRAFMDRHKRGKDTAA